MAIFRPQVKPMVCSECGYPLAPGKRFDVLTNNTGGMWLFCQKEGCQAVMRLLVGHQSGGIKLPIPYVERSVSHA